VLGNADLALRDLDAGSPGRSCVERIQAAARRASELTNQLLAYSGKGRFIVEWTDLNVLVEEMVELLQTAVSKKVDLRLDLDRSLPGVDADVSQIRQVVMNLITNASEAIGDESGEIDIRTSVVEVDDGGLLRGYLPQDAPAGRYVRLEVRDSGCGMDEETRRKLFDPFFTTKFAGRGLGLAAVLGIVRGHRAAIRVESAVGRGSTFTLLFPISPRSPDARQEAPDLSREHEVGGTVLVIDDEAGVRHVARAMLESAGFEVLTAADGREGLDLFDRHRDETSLVLLDLTMPHLDGEETFRRLRERRPDLPVVLSSGLGEQDMTERFAGLGLTGFIQKPYGLDELVLTVRGALRGPRAR
jgi:CheY-like chemotaxis protein